MREFFEWLFSMKPALSDFIVIGIFIAILLPCGIASQSHPSDSRSPPVHATTAVWTPKTASGWDQVWNQTWDAANTNYGYAVATDVNGDAFLVGYAEGNFPVAIVIKYNPSGGEVWAQNWGDYVEYTWSGVATDANGNVFLAGTYHQSSMIADKAILVKDDQGGNQVWNRTRIGFNASEYTSGVGVATDSSGDSYIAGHTYYLNGDENETAFLAKYDPNGNSLWNVTWDQENYLQVSGIATDASGNSFVADEGGSNINLAKYDTNGTLLWNHTISGISAEYGIGIATDASGDAYLSGEVWGSGNGPVVAVLEKYDANGLTIWNQTWGQSGDNYGKAVATDASGGVFLAGDTDGYGAGGNDAFLAKYDASGLPLWNRTWGGANDDYGTGVATDKWGNTFLVGSTKSFGAGNENAFIAKFTPDGGPYPAALPYVMPWVTWVIIIAAILVLSIGGTTIFAKKRPKDTLQSKAQNSSLQPSEQILQFNHEEQLPAVEGTSPQEVSAQNGISSQGDGSDVAGKVQSNSNLYQKTLPLVGMGGSILGYFAFPPCNLSMGVAGRLVAIAVVASNIILIIFSARYFWGKYESQSILQFDTAVGALNLASFLAIFDPQINGSSTQPYVLALGPAVSIATLGLSLGIVGASITFLSGCVGLRDTTFRHEKLPPLHSGQGLYVYTCVVILVGVVGLSLFALTLIIIGVLLAGFWAYIFNDQFERKLNWAITANVTALAQKYRNQINARKTQREEQQRRAELLRLNNALDSMEQWYQDGQYGKVMANCSQLKVQVAGMSAPELAQKFKSLEARAKVASESVLENVHSQLQGISAQIDAGDFAAARGLLEDAQDRFDQLKFPSDTGPEINAPDFSEWKARIDHAEQKWKVHLALLTLGQQFSRVLLQEVAIQAELPEDVVKGLVLEIIRDGVIPARFDEKTNGIELMVEMEELDALRKQFDEWQDGKKQ